MQHIDTIIDNRKNKPITYLQLLASSKIKWWAAQVLFNKPDVKKKQ